MNYFLRDEKVILRKLSEEESFENYLKFINDVENLIWVAWVGRYPLNLEDLKAYLASNNDLFLAIFDLEDHHVGNIQLSRVDHIHRNAEFGMILAKNEMGKGYATSASKLVLGHAFEVLNLHRIYLSVAEQNKNAVKLYERLGFVAEGIEKELHRWNFEYHDYIRYRMLESEYVEVMKK